ncbi:MAG: Gfo/Idh/MocA family oxidoreductase [Mucinivorans sp.]
MKVGIIGLGSIARKHIAAVRALDLTAQFYALRHTQTSPAQDGVNNVYSYEELLAVQPDFIIISNPTAAHRAAIERLAQEHIPLMIEKPLSDTLAAPVMVDGLTYVACNLRFLESIQYIKQQIDGQRVNEVNTYCGSSLPSWRAGVAWRECYSANKEMGGGVHIDLIHEIDYLYWLFGAPQKVTKIFRNVSSLGISAIDYANYTIEYPGFTASVVLNYYRCDSKRTLEIVTDKETWIVDLLKNSVNRNGKIVFQSDRTIGDTYATQMRHFVAAIASGERFNDINQAYDVLKICLEDGTKR